MTNLLPIIRNDISRIPVNRYSDKTYLHYKLTLKNQHDITVLRSIAIDKTQWNYLYNCVAWYKSDILWTFSCTVIFCKLLLLPTTKQKIGPSLLKRGPCLLSIQNTIIGFSADQNFSSKIPVRFFDLKPDRTGSPKNQPEPGPNRNSGRLLARELKWVIEIFSSACRTMMRVHVHTRSESGRNNPTMHVHHVSYPHLPWFLIPNWSVCFRQK